MRNIRNYRKDPDIMKLLLTAFDPFGGEQINPAYEAIRQLPDEIGNIEVAKLMVPTVFKASITAVTAEIEKIHPDAVICVGQAGGRTGITVERIAINCQDARIPDNEGNQPVDEPVSADGSAAYFSTLPIKKMVEAMKTDGIPAAVSNTAGTFVCNQLMYGVLEYIENHGLPVKAGFIHVPFLPAQAAQKQEIPASMALADIVRGLIAAIRCLEQ